MPPLGYRVYKLYAGADESARGGERHDRRERAPGARGRPSHRLALAAGRQADRRRPRGVGPHAVVVDDGSDTWGHGVLRFDTVAGEFECTGVRLVEHGPVRAVIRIESRFGDSTLVEDVVLGAGARFVEVRATLDWRERLRLLKLKVPDVGADRPRDVRGSVRVSRASGGRRRAARASVGGRVRRRRRALGRERLQVRARRAGRRHRDHRRAHAVYAWHHPRELDDPTGNYEYLDQGRQDLVYRLVPHAGDWRDAGTVRVAAELNQPAFTLIESYHPGELPPSGSFLADGGGDVVVTVLKASEDDDALVVRARMKSAGRAARATIELPLLERTVEADFGPCGDQDVPRAA